MESGYVSANAWKWKRKKHRLRQQKRLRVHKNQEEHGARITGNPTNTFQHAVHRWVKATKRENLPGTGNTVPGIAVPGLFHSEKQTVAALTATKGVLQDADKGTTGVDGRRITLVTGGERSGKSRFAQDMALGETGNPVYLATSRIWDEEFRLRVIRHQKDRGKEWTNVEEEKFLSRHDFNGRVVVIDCVTLWLTNFFFDARDNMQPDSVLAEAKAEFDKFVRPQAHYIFITNEIGMGGVPIDPVQRHFTDLQGWMNQYIASQADEVILMVSGIPLRVKS